MHDGTIGKGTICVEHQFSHTLGNQTYGDRETNHRKIH